jgi:hypothetical protein
MQTLRRLLFLPLAALLAVGCSDDSGTNVDDTEDGVTVADLVGSWKASSHTFTNNADPSQTFDLVANGGETRVTVLNGGGARTWVEIGDFSDEWDAQLTISGTNLISTPVEASRGVQTHAFTLVGNTLTLTDSNSEFDFTLLGEDPVPATQVVVLVRQ